MDVLELKVRKIFVFNRLHAIWPKGYQSRSLRKNLQNGDFLKQAMQKSYLATGFEPAALDYRSTHHRTRVFIVSIFAPQLFKGSVFVLVRAYCMIRT